MRTLAFALALAVLGAGCSNNNTTTSPASPTGPVTDTFSSAVAVGGTASHGFTMLSTGTIAVTLTALDGTKNVVGLGLGVLNGTTCSLTVSVNTAPGSTPQITASADPGTYCVEVYDIGNLKAPSGLVVTIVHP